MKKSILFIVTFLFVSLSCSATGEKHSTQKGEAMKIQIQIQSGSEKHKLTATLDDNSSAKAFYELLQKGHGHFDLTAYEQYLAGKIQDCNYSEEEVQEALKDLPKVNI